MTPGAFMILTQRQDAILLSAAETGGGLTVREISTRCEWHVMGVPLAADDRLDVQCLVAEGLLVRADHSPRTSAGDHTGPMHAFRLTTAGYRAAWNVSD